MYEDSKILNRIPAEEETVTTVVKERKEAKDKLVSGVNEVIYFGEWLLLPEREQVLYFIVSL